MFSLVLVQLKPQRMPKTEVGSLKKELDDLGWCSGLPVFTFHKDGGSQISPQLPEISKVGPVFVQIESASRVFWIGVNSSSIELKKAF